MEVDSKDSEVKRNARVAVLGGETYIAVAVKVKRMKFCVLNNRVHSTEYEVRGKSGRM